MGKLSKTIGKPWRDNGKIMQINQIRLFSSIYAFLPNEKMVIIGELMVIAFKLLSETIPIGRTMVIALITKRNDPN